MKRLMTALALACVAGCGLGSDPWAGQKGKVRVIATIPPLASFVREIGGDHVSVIVLCEQTGPHHYAADARDLGAFRTAHMFLTVGLSLDDTFARTLFAQARREIPFLKVGDMLPTDLVFPMGHGHDHAHGHTHAHGHDHSHGGHHHGKDDPHVWLGVPQAVAIVGIIRDELSKLDPEHEEEFKKNAKAFVAQLEKLQADGQKLFKDRKSRRFIAFHDSFAYFAKSFGLEVAAAMEVEPGDAPTPAYLAKIVKLCESKTKPIGSITVEPQFAEGSAKTVKDELKAKGISIKLARVDPLETGVAREIEKEKGDWYLSRMRKNLKALADALP